MHDKMILVVGIRHTAASVSPHVRVGKVRSGQLSQASQVGVNMVRV